MIFTQKQKLLGSHKIRLVSNPKAIDVSLQCQTKSLANIKSLQPKFYSNRKKLILAHRQIHTMLKLDIDIQDNKYYVFCILIREGC